jgi:hypothetical protein
VFSGVKKALMHMAFQEAAISPVSWSMNARNEKPWKDIMRILASIEAGTAKLKLFCSPTKWVTKRDCLDYTIILVR